VGTGRPVENRRARVLRALRRAPAPTGVAVLADRLAMHPNTVRFHLDALQREGLVARVRGPALGRGRPAVLYRAVVRRDTAVRRYELLADILTTALGEHPDGRAHAARAGRAWGRVHSGSSGDVHADPVERLAGYLDEAGFAPQRVSADVIEVRNCPFGEVADRGARIACAAHAGMIRGALEDWDAGMSLADLEPFARPGICRVRLAGTTSAGSTP